MYFNFVDIAIYNFPGIFANGYFVHCLFILTRAWPTKASVVPCAGRRFLPTFSTTPLCFRPSRQRRRKFCQGVTSGSMRVATVSHCRDFCCLVIALFLVSRNSDIIIILIDSFTTHSLVHNFISHHRYSMNHYITS